MGGEGGGREREGENVFGNQDEFGEREREREESGEGGVFWKSKQNLEREIR